MPSVTVYGVSLDAAGVAVDIDVEYRVFGKHYPATRHSPEEWPEVEIVEIDAVRISEDEDDTTVSADDESVKAEVARVTSDGDFIDRVYDAIDDQSLEY